MYCSWIRKNSASEVLQLQLLLAYLSISMDHVLVTRQFFQPAGTAGVEFIGADANLSAEAELAPVIESCAGVDHHGGTINTRRKLAGRLIVARHNRIGMFRSIAVDVLNGFIRRPNHAR